MEKSNFQFLEGVNDILYRPALAAERNYPDDPNATMAKHIAKLLCIEIPEKQHELLRDLARIPWVATPSFLFFTSCVSWAILLSMTFMTMRVMQKIVCASVSVWRSWPVLRPVRVSLKKL